MNHPESSSNGTSEQQHAAVATTDMNMMNSSTASAGSTGNDNNNTSGTSDALSESTIEQMRQQVMHQRVKVEEERYAKIGVTCTARVVDSKPPLAVM